MDIVGIIVIIFLIFGMVIGAVRGFTKELVSLIGIFVILILSFLFKNELSVFLYTNLPFFKFGGIFKDITVLNILLYETIAFLIIFSVLMIILKLLLALTTFFEEILTLTIILGIPSKILGAILGFVEALIYVFITLYILKLPVFNFKIIQESETTEFILNTTPVLKDVCDKSLDVFNEIVELKDEYNETNDKKAFNQKALDIMIENNVITKENAEMLIKKGKIKDVIVK